MDFPSNALQVFSRVGGTMQAEDSLFSIKPQVSQVLTVPRTLVYAFPESGAIGSHADSALSSLSVDQAPSTAGTNFTICQIEAGLWDIEISWMFSSNFALTAIWSLIFQYQGQNVNLLSLGQAFGPANINGDIGPVRFALGSPARILTTATPTGVGNRLSYNILVSSSRLS